MRAALLFLAVGLTGFAADLRIGIVGTDTSHATEFTKILNDPSASNHVSGARVVAAFKGGSPDLKESSARVDQYANELRDKWHVAIVDSIPELTKQVDAIMLNSIDGRVHLAQARRDLRRSQAGVHRQADGLHAGRRARDCPPCERGRRPLVQFLQLAL
jgi:hypothetical protein